MRNVCWRVGVVGCVVGLFLADAEAQNPTLSVRPVAGIVDKECVGGPDAGQDCTTTGTAGCENDGEGEMHPDCQRLCNGDPERPCEVIRDCAVSGGGACEQQCSCNSVVSISNPGLPILYEIFASDWGIRPVASWQVVADFTSTSDSVLPYGWDRPIPDLPQCSSNDDCTLRYPECGETTGRCQGPGHEPCLGAFICEQCTLPGSCNRSDYIFSGCAEFGALDYSTLDYRLGTTTPEAICQWPFGYQPPPKYVATFIVLPTATACGSVTIKLGSPPLSGLSDPQTLLLEPLDIEGLTLEFGSCECTGILDSDPPDCAVDARQTSDPSGTPAQGIESIALNLEGPTPDEKCPSTAGLDRFAFTMREVPGTGTFFPDSVTHDTPAAGWATLHFPPATPGVWTCVEFSGDETCFGYLPGDADNDRTSLASDIPYLIDCIIGDETCGDYQCDIDRSGLCGASDVLREIDLLNGATPYSQWDGQSLSTTCP